MFYYGVIPLTKIPLGKNPEFTYSSEEQLAYGSVVEVEFSQTVIKGIVTKQTNKPFFITKPVRKVLSKDVFTSRQIALAYLISDQNYTPVGVVLKFFLPSLVKKSTPLEFASFVSAGNSACVKLTKAQDSAVNKILSGMPQRQFLLQGPASSGKTEVAAEIIRKILKKGKQALVLVPEVLLSRHEIVRYRRYFIDLVGEEGIVWFSAGLTGSQFTYNWRNVKQGKARIIIATRRGLFLPFQDLGLIFVDEEQDVSYKQWDQNPRYHARQTAKLLASQYADCKLVYASATPSVELSGSFSPEQKIDLPMLEIPGLKVRRPGIKVVDMRNYSVKKNRKEIIISKELLTALKKNLEEGKLAMLVVNYRGKSRGVVCQDCKKTLVCPACGVRLIHSGSGYKCMHCAYGAGSFPKCPACGSMRLADIGFGTEKIADELSRRFTGARIRVFDRETMQKKSQQQTLSEELLRQQVDIIVGTQTITKGFDFPRVGLIGVLNAEDWMGESDYLHQERKVAGLFQFCGRLNRPGSDQQGIAVIQTYNPKSKAIQALQQWSWKVFLEEELAIRQAAGFPPYKNLIKLTYKDSVQEKVDKISQKVYKELDKEAVDESGEALYEVMEPFYGFRQRERNVWKKHIVLKVSDDFPVSLKDKLIKLSKQWTIDIGPENIF
jgi:primosomal protein N' (replication factor Y)